jgi:hypothetical protein
MDVPLDQQADRVAALEAEGHRRAGTDLGLRRPVTSRT